MNTRLESVLTEICQDLNKSFQKEGVGGIWDGKETGILGACTGYDIKRGYDSGNDVWRKERAKTLMGKDGICSEIFYPEYENGLGDIADPMTPRIYDFIQVYGMMPINTPTYDSLIQKIKSLGYDKVNVMLIHNGNRRCIVE